MRFPRMVRVLVNLGTFSRGSISIRIVHRGIRRLAVLGRVDVGRGFRRQVLQLLSPEGEVLIRTLGGRVTSLHLWCGEVDLCLELVRGLSRRLSRVVRAYLRGIFRGVGTALFGVFRLELCGVPLERTPVGFGRRVVLCVGSTISPPGVSSDWGIA